MDIFINEQKIDFKLENETILSEVVEGLSRWAKESGYHIQDILFNNRVYFDNAVENGKTSLETVSEIKVEAKNRLEIHQDNLQLLYQYVSLFLKSLEGENKTLMAELKDNAPTLTRLLADFLEEDKNAVGNLSTRLLENINLLEPDNINTDDEHFKALVRQLSGLKIILNERISEFGNPLGELSKTVSALKLSRDEINDISILLQTGKDREALNCIIRFSELSQKILRLYPILNTAGWAVMENIVIDGKKFSEYYLDLNSILSELLEAFTANDSVLIGDLLEYEIAPRLESLITVLDEIIKENQQ